MVRRGVVAVAVLVLLAGACGSTKKSSGGGAGGDGAGGAGAAAENGPGVTDEAIKVGFVNVRLGEVQQRLGFFVPDQGDARAQAQALMDWVNANGGIGGRDLEVVVRDFDAENATPQSEESMCNGFAQDDKVFAAVIQGQFSPSARPCYARQGVVVLDIDTVALDTQAYEEMSPYLWQVILPPYDEFLPLYADQLVEAGFFDDDAVVGAVALDSEVNKRSLARFEDALADQGKELATVEYIPGTDTVAIIGNVQGAIDRLKAAGVDHLLALGGGRLLPFVAQFGTYKDFTPKMAFSTYDDPIFWSENSEKFSPESLDGAVGVGTQLNRDLRSEQLAFPQAREEQCVDIYGEAGITFESRSAARTAIGFCDSVLLLRAAADGVEGGFNAEVFQARVQDLGDEFQAASAYESDFDAEHHAGGAAFMVMRWDAGAKAFVPEGDPQPLERG